MDGTASAEVLTEYVDGWAAPQEIVYREFNSLRGRLLAVIESANLPKTQERALKTLVKNLTYQQEAIIRELVRKLDTGDRVFRYAEKLDAR